MKTQFDAKKVERILNRGLTVADLIEALQQQDPEARVVFACDYGDHCHTEQALPVSECDQLYDDSHFLDDSAYSQSGIAIREFDTDDETGEPEIDVEAKHFNVVVLK